MASDSSMVTPPTRTRSRTCPDEVPGVSRSVRVAVWHSPTVVKVVLVGAAVAGLSSST
jgi:hypothetical protein